MERPKTLETANISVGRACILAFIFFVCIHEVVSIGCPKHTTRHDIIGSCLVVSAMALSLSFVALCKREISRAEMLIKQIKSQSKNYEIRQIVCLPEKQNMNESVNTNKQK